MNRQKLLLSALLLLFALSLAYSFWRMPRQKRVEKLRYTPGITAERARVPQAVPVDEKKVQLELLDREAARFAGFRRNIFRPIFHEELKPGPPLPERPSLPPAPPVMPVAPPPPPAVEPTPVQRDMAQFTFLGFLKKDGVKTIFLSKGNEIFLVKKGDTVAGKYAVSALTDEALTIRPLTEGGEIVIPLVESRPLRAPAK